MALDEPIQRRDLAGQRPQWCGVVVFWPVLAEFGVVILLTLLTSVVVTLVGTALVLDRLAARFMPGDVSETPKND